MVYTCNATGSGGAGVLAQQALYAPGDTACAGGVAARAVLWRGRNGACASAGGGGFWRAVTCYGS